MAKDNKIFSLVIFSLLVLGCNNTVKTAETNPPLNFILITADDLNYNSIGAYGNTIADITPNIDKLAAQGMLFTNAYVNIAVCQPSRQSIMTGLYPHSNGAPGFDPIDESVITLQEVLHKEGFLNGIIGKEKHLQPMEKFYWDFYIKEGEVASGLGIGRDPELYYKNTFEFLSKAKQEKKPFFLMANSHDPHRPFADSDEEKSFWGDDLPVFTRKISKKEVAVPDFLFDLPKIRQEIAEYYTSVHRCDETVGAILKALEDSGLEDNTLVMFLSDNGMSVPFAKSNTYLNSNKTPWIVRWPEHTTKGSIEKTHFISGVDFMPTILEALKLPQLPGMQGRSFLPLLKGEKQSGREVVFTEFHKIFAGNEYPMRCVITERYGYIVNFWSDGNYEIKGDAMSGRTFKAMNEAAKSDTTIAKRVDLYKFRVTEELYDFKNDPDALVNLIDEPDAQIEKKRLKDLLYSQLEKSNDPLKEEFEKRFLQ